MSNQLALDVDAPPIGELYDWCGIPDCDCESPKLPDTGWRAARERIVAEREKADAA